VLDQQLGRVDLGRHVILSVRNTAPFAAEVLGLVANLVSFAGVLEVGARKDLAADRALLRPRPNVTYLRARERPVRVVLRVRARAGSAPSR